MDTGTRTALVIGAAATGALVILSIARAREASGSPSEESLEPWRRQMLDCVSAHEREGTLYEWGGGHGFGPDWGLDCSGLVNVCAQQAGLDVSMNSETMRASMPEVQSPRPGDLALYGPSNATHVRVVVAWHPDEMRAETIGSEGGGRAMTTPEAAIAADARVKYVPDHRNRKDFLGFHTMSGHARPGPFSSRPMFSLPG